MINIARISLLTASLSALPVMALAGPAGQGALPYVASPSYSAKSIAKQIADNETSESAAQKANGVPMALTYLKHETTSLIYLGDQGGVRAYLGRATGGLTQTFYIWPNGVNFVAGTLFDANGKNVSSAQIKAMKARFTAASNNHQARIQPVDPKNITFGKNPRDIPVMHHILDRRGSMYLYIGGDGGTPAYLVKVPASGGAQDQKAHPHGLVQAFYVTPDGNHAVAGIMMGEDGQDITGTHLKRMRQRFSQFIAAPFPGISDNKTAQTVPEPHIHQKSLPAVKAAMNNGSTGTVQVPSSDQGGSTIEGPAPALPAVSKSKFEAEVQYTASFTVGKSTAPTVWMVADPQCPRCHRAWKALKPMVLSGDIKLRVILVDAHQNSLRYNIALMTQPNPGLDWLKGWGSTGNLSEIPAAPAKTSPAYARAVGWLDDNTAFVNKVGITAAPFLAYTSKSGVFHAAQVPSSVKTFLSGLGD